MAADAHATRPALGLPSLAHARATGPNTHFTSRQNPYWYTQIPQHSGRASLPYVVLCGPDGLSRATPKTPSTFVTESASLKKKRSSSLHNERAPGRSAVTSTQPFWHGADHSSRWRSFFWQCRRRVSNRRTRPDAQNSRSTHSSSPADRLGARTLYPAGKATQVRTL